MSYYKLKVRRNDAEVEVVAKDGALLAREVDKYLEIFLNTKLAAPEQNYEAPRQAETMQDVYVHPHADAVFSQPQFVQEPQIQVQQPIEQPATPSNMTLGEFISGSKCAQIFDEFIASAYYLKKIGAQQAFTLKFLNSKFYPATNKLIDFAVIEEGKNRGFIDAIDDEGTTKYCLNVAGEEYFLTQLQ